MTTIKISTSLRDALASVAARYGDVSLAETLRRLLVEHEDRKVLAAYERLRADEDEWASYRDESRLTDNLAGDGLRSWASCPDDVTVRGVTCVTNVRSKCTAASQAARPASTVPSTRA